MAGLRKNRFLYSGVALAAITLIAAFLFLPTRKSPEEDVETTAARPSLSVEVATLQAQAVPIRVSANGGITAWQEASIGTQTNGLRLVEIKADVGDSVRKGQVLARFAQDEVQVDLAKSQAAAAEAKAALAQASGDARRARALTRTGTLSGQQIHQFETAELTARARHAAALAEVRAQMLRLEHTRVLATDDGVISVRYATVGAVPSSGQELFRLIRDHRLEWRAEVAEADLDKLRPGQSAILTLAGGQQLTGRLRTVAPLVDASTRRGIVHVDLPPNDFARPGMYARGELVLGSRQAWTLPRSAIQIQDGFSYVLRVVDPSRVLQAKVVLGEPNGDRVEIVSGLDPASQVVAVGGAFLGDGDHVRVIGDSN